MNLIGRDGCSHMTQKLFTFVAGECTAENPDNPMFQEALLSGHLYQMVLKVCHVTLGGSGTPLPDGAQGMSCHPRGLSGHLYQMVLKVCHVTLGGSVDTLPDGAQGMSCHPRGLSGHLYQMVLKVCHVTLGGSVDTSTRWCSRYVMSP